LAKASEVCPLIEKKDSNVFAKVRKKKTFTIAAFYVLKPLNATLHCYGKLKCLAKTERNFFNECIAVLFHLNANSQSCKTRKVLAKARKYTLFMSNVF